MQFKTVTNILIFLISSLFFSCNSKPKVNFEYDKNEARVEFAISQINKALQSEGIIDKDLSVTFRLDSTCCEKEGFILSVSENKAITIAAAEPNGLMYGGLNLAEQIALHAEIKSTSKTPYIKKRGIKFNVPLDARTPSYDDSGDAAQQNIAEMWEWDFWEKFIDQMAIDRYNVLSLWNPHPFPSMIKMTNYPDIALDDVCVTTLKPVGKENEWAEPQMVSSNVIANLKVVKTLTIDEKIAFWKKVLQHAKDRGIEVYFFTWNICANGAANPVEPFYRTYNQPLWDEKPGKYGITNQMDNPINVAYYREAVKEFLLTYPTIKGIGVTAGEHMLDEAGNYNREQWIWETYGLGILDAKKEQPNRHVDFIHRVWNSDMNKIMHYWKDYPDSFEASFKYARARLYSSPYLNFADKHIEAMKPYNLKSWWNLRNDDIFVYRWGDPDYVRTFIGQFQRDYTAGFYMGSDGYVWGKEFVSKEAELSGQLEITKHWFNFMLWGRLSYDNTLDNEFFVQKLKAHFPETNAELLLSSWQSASEIIPMVNCFHWNDWDYQWSVEACIDERTGFHSVAQFMNNRTRSGSNILNPTAYAKSITKQLAGNEITPFQVADSLQSMAALAIAGVDQLRNKSNSIELNTLLDDALAMSYLGNYYAMKIRAASELALLKQTKDESHRSEAVSFLEKAVGYWTQYTEVSEKNYRPQMLARTSELDWRMRLEQVKEDVEIAKKMSQK